MVPSGRHKQNSTVAGAAESWSWTLTVEKREIAAIFFDESDSENAEIFYWFVEILCMFWGYLKVCCASVHSRFPQNHVITHRNTHKLWNWQNYSFSPQNRIIKSTIFFFTTPQNVHNIQAKMGNLYVTLPPKMRWDCYWVTFGVQLVSQRGCRTIEFGFSTKSVSPVFFTSE